MMATYQPQPGAMHPGMAPHGHPVMTPGQPMTPAQMPQMGHPGAAAPGGPHVTQAGAMMAMQPGANGVGGPDMSGQHPGAQMGGMPGQMGAQSMAGVAPTAHAMSHLNNQQAAMQQQHLMQQQMQANPHLAMQQHQAMMQRRAQMAAQMQAQANANGMAAMQGMNPQQMQQLQQGNIAMHPQGVQLPQHLQQQQLQLRMQQQAAAAQQHSQQLQQLAMQHANSQNSNQGGQQAPPNQQGGQPQNPQMRPQSRMANAKEQSQGGPQQGGQQSAPQVAQPQPQQPQPQPQQGQPSQQPGAQQAPQQQGQQQQMNPQQMQAMAQAQRAQQMRAMQMQQLQQQQQRMQQSQSQGGSGFFILKVMLFGDQLSSFDSASGKDLALWHAFVDKNFATDGRFLHSFAFPESKKTYEVPRPTIARYFQMYFDSNAVSIRLHAEHGRETPMPPNRHQVSFSSATFTVSYPNGARLEMSGSVSVLFAPQSDLIECMEVFTQSTEEHVSRSEIERVLTSYSPTMSSKTSPKMTKNNRIPKAQQKMQSQYEALTIDHFPKAPTGTMGVTARVQQFLEIGETMNVMSDLISFAQEKRLRPEQAMEALLAQYENPPQVNQQGNPQINLPHNGVPVGNRTPSMQHMQMPNAQGGNQFSSPSVANLNLPMQNGMPGGMNGSPHIANNAGLAPNMNMNMPNSHTPSPHQSNMAAPQMVPQHSQQGTNSSAASANTSPQVNNKRRRSTVKLESDGGGGDDIAANRVKPSPRMNKKNKPGGPA